jgi:phage FluMu protein Com
MGHFHVDCPNCHKRFLLVYRDYVDGIRQQTTLEISSCTSGGIYSVEVKCPHCKHTEDLV